METHIKVLAVLFIVYGALGLVLSLLLALAFGGATGLAGVDQPVALLAIPIVGVIGRIIVGFTLLMAIPRIVAGFGLINVPFGTVLGIYGLWVLLQKGAEPAFGIAPTATGDPLRAPPPSS
ncbi:MAG: hypothetical protein O3A25_06060 [Acidobacteria bacterium]|nr:hypothetical protein [Acidobacteriota bacterium]